MNEEVTRGVGWTMASYAVNKAVTFGSTLVLARLLVPADFGVFALASTVVLLLGFLRDMGIGNSLILHPEFGPRQRGTVLTLLTAFAAAVALIGMALSPVVAGFFGEERLQGVLLALGGAIALSGPRAFNEITLQRQLRFRAMFACETLAAGVYTSVAITTAATGAGVWSLVAAQIASAVTALFATSIANRRSLVRPAFDADAARIALRTGRPFVAQSLLYFGQQNADYIAIGRVLGAAQTGLYTTAFRIAEIPQLALAAPIARVMFPVFAERRRRGEDVRGPLLDVLGITACVTTICGVILSALATPLVLVLYGERWEAMAPALTILGLWAAVRPLQSTLAWSLNSMKLASANLKASLWLTGPLVAGIAVGVHHGIVVVASVVLAYVLVQTAATAWQVSRHADLPLRRLASRVAPALAAGAPAWAMAHAATIGDLPAALELVAGGAAGLVVYTSILRRLEPDVVSGLVRATAAKLPRRRDAGRPATRTLAG